MVSLLFFILASICNAVMDTIQFHFEGSVFNSIHCNRQYWGPATSWRNKYVNGDPKQGLKRKWGVIVPVAFTDAWHMFKSAMIIFLAISVVTFNIEPMTVVTESWLNMLCLLIVYGTCWNCTFSLFFNKLLKK